MLQSKVFNKKIRGGRIQKVFDVLEFRASEISAAVALSVSGELHTSQFEKFSFTSFFSHLEKFISSPPHTQRVLIESQRRGARDKRAEKERERIIPADVLLECVFSNFFSPDKPVFSKMSITFDDTFISSSNHFT